MKEFFFHKRATGPEHRRGDAHTQVLYVRGWTNDVDGEPKDHVVNVTTGSHPLHLSREMTKLTNALNAVMTLYYNGELK